MTTPLVPLINSQDEQFAKEQLDSFYKKGLIPAEKKNYLSKLKYSFGPFMGIESEKADETHFLLDAASQIATLGLGFNPTPFFGVAHFLESWINDSSTLQFKNLDYAFHQLIKRYLNLKNKDPLFLTYVNSGAEANELALGECFKKRINKKAFKVLAFEGSFHGRMLVTLSATWNKAKREPFEWPSYEAVYCAFPELLGDQIIQNKPQDWCQLWALSSSSSFVIPALWRQGPEIEREINSLLQVREEIIKGDVYAIIVEPMQCEGGDRYASNRFFEALLLLAKSYSLPVIFDEVQTGFHLGQEFFWHQQFKLQDHEGHTLSPDYIVCAKKAQVGMVISDKKIDRTPEFQVASVLRGYIHALSLGQMTDKILEIEAKTRNKCQELNAKHPEFFERPRAMGLSFAIDVKTPEQMTQFVNKRFEKGLLYYPAGDKTLRFRMNTAFGHKEINFLFEQLDNLAKEIFHGEKSVAPVHCPTDFKEREQIYEWHEYLLTLKLDILNRKPRSFEIVFKEIAEFFKGKGQLTLVTKDNLKLFAPQIENLQKKIYEPLRQTPLELFEKTVKDPAHIALVLEEKGVLKAIAFGAPPANYPLESALRADHYFNDPETLYMIDVTVDEDQKAQGLGKNLKYAIVALALAKGLKRINGKNRDVMARQMLMINLSLGAIEQFYRKEHYLDFEKNRDLFYYSNTLTFEKENLSLSEMPNIPLGIQSLSSEFIKDQLPYVVNKVCLSNFVGPRFLQQLDDLFKLCPESLRSGYSTSGLSECVDKVSKSIWATGRKKTSLLTFQGHYFGQGSNLSASLSLKDYAYFDVKRVNHPTEQNAIEILKEIEALIQNDQILAIFLEPMPQNILKAVPLSFLISLRQLSTKYKTPVVYNETASQKYNFSEDYYFASTIPEITPDALIAFLGGQAGFVALKKEHFLEKPLMMISTWDGDEFSFANYHHSMKLIEQNKLAYKKCKKIFQKQLAKELKNYPVSIDMNRGVGTIVGHVPLVLKKNLKMIDGKFMVLPSWDAMKEFLTLKII